MEQLGKHLILGCSVVYSPYRTEEFKAKMPDFGPSVLYHRWYGSLSDILSVSFSHGAASAYSSHVCEMQVSWMLCADCRCIGVFQWPWAFLSICHMFFGNAINLLNNCVQCIVSRRNKSAWGSGCCSYHCLSWAGHNPLFVSWNHVENLEIC